MNPNRRTLERTRRRSKALESTAYHEAGHAFMASHLQIPFNEATVVPGEDYLGAVIGLKVKHLRKNISRGPTTKEKLEKWILVLLAGAIAQQSLNLGVGDWVIWQDEQIQVQDGEGNLDVVLNSKHYGES